ncbi:putative holin-like toxin [Staphylococcus massiliensis]
MLLISDALHLMIEFGIFTLTLIGVIITIINYKNNHPR